MFLSTYAYLPRGLPRTWCAVLNTLPARYRLLIHTTARCYQLHALLTF